MTKKNVKTVLTRDDIVELLNVYLIMDEICTDFQEIFDTDLAKVRKLQDMSQVLKNLFDFRPRKNDEGNPNHWQPYVMPDDDRAWYHVPEEDQ